MQKVLPEELIKDIQIIHNEAKRCRGIVQDLLLFSRKREPKCELIDINKPLENMLE